MNDDLGWYLPFMYLDGYIDQHGPFSVAKGVADVVKGVVDEELCFRLSWFMISALIMEKINATTKVLKEITLKTMKRCMKTLLTIKHCFTLAILRS